MEVIYKNSRIIMEIGATYNPGFNLYDGNVNQRNSYIKDGIWINDISKIDGLYAEKEISGLNLLPAEKSNLKTAVYYSLTPDHMANMGVISNDIDVFYKKCSNHSTSFRDIGNGVFSKGHIT